MINECEKLILYFNGLVENAVWIKQKKKYKIEELKHWVKLFERFNQQLKRLDELKESEFTIVKNAADEILGSLTLDKDFNKAEEELNKTEAILQKAQNEWERLEQQKEREEKFYNLQKRLYDFQGSEFPSLQYKARLLFYPSLKEENEEATKQLEELDKHIKEFEAEEKELKIKWDEYNTRFAEVKMPLKELQQSPIAEIKEIAGLILQEELLKDLSKVEKQIRDMKYTIETLQTKEKLTQGIQVFQNSSRFKEVRDLASGFIKTEDLKEIQWFAQKLKSIEEELENSLKRLQDDIEFHQKDVLEAEKDPEYKAYSYLVDNVFEKNFSIPGKIEEGFEDFELSMRRKISKNEEILQEIQKHKLGKIEDEKLFFLEKVPTEEEEFEEFFERNSPSEKILDEKITKKQDAEILEKLDTPPNPTEVDSLREIQKNIHAKLEKIEKSIGLSVKLDKGEKSTLVEKLKEQLKRVKDPTTITTQEEFERSKEELQEIESKKIPLLEEFIAKKKKFLAQLETVNPSSGISLETETLIALYPDLAERAQKCIEMIIQEPIALHEAALTFYNLGANSALQDYQKIIREAELTHQAMKRGETDWKNYLNKLKLKVSKLQEIPGKNQILSIFQSKYKDIWDFASHVQKPERLDSTVAKTFYRGKISELNNKEISLTQVNDFIISSVNELSKLKEPHKEKAQLLIQRLLDLFNDYSIQNAQSPEWSQKKKDLQNEITQFLEDCQKAQQIQARLEFAFKSLENEHLEILPFYSTKFEELKKQYQEGTLQKEEVLSKAQELLEEVQQFKQKKKELENGFQGMFSQSQSYFLTMNKEALSRIEGKENYSTQLSKLFEDIGTAANQNLADLEQMGSLKELEESETLLKLREMFFTVVEEYQTKIIREVAEREDIRIFDLMVNKFLDICPSWGITKETFEGFINQKEDVNTLYNRYLFEKPEDANNRRRRWEILRNCQQKLWEKFQLQNLASSRLTFEQKKGIELKRLFDYIDTFWEMRQKSSSKDTKS